MAIGTNIFASSGLSGSAQLGGSVGDGNGSASLAADTYGPPANGGNGGAFSPRHGVGLGFWLAVGGVVVLVCIRQSLPR